MNARKEIPNLELKEALMQTPIKHGGVALRVLHRIDHDTEFRAALQAALATGDNEVVAKFVYSHFEPEIVQKDCIRREKMPTLRPPVSAAQLVRLINDRAIEIAAEYLSDGALDTAVDTYMRNQLHHIVASVVGFRDSFGRLEIDPHAKDTAVAKGIKARIVERVAARIDMYLEEIDIEELTNTMFKKAGENVREVYKRCMDHLMEDHMRVWAAERARIDLDRLFSQADAALSEGALGEDKG